MKSITLQSKASGRRTDAAGDLRRIKRGDDLRTAAKGTELHILLREPHFFQSDQRSVSDGGCRTIGADNLAFELLDVLDFRTGVEVPDHRV